VTEPQAAEDRLQWLREHTSAHPVIVAESDGEIIGWGALGSFRPRAAYARTAELSVYVHHDFHRRGIGRAITTDLISRAQALGYHALIGGCCSESTASIGLLERFGFTRVGHLTEVGRKFDRWLDVAFLQKLL
jgi:phosphinothricin acetyltransferase